MAEENPGIESGTEHEAEDGQSSISSCPSDWSLLQEDSYKFKNPIEHLKCSECNLLAINPYQLHCQDEVYIVCGDCICRSRTKGILKKCIKCNRILCSKPFQDRRLQMEINRLEVYCIHRDDGQGCQWEGAFADYDAHINQECLYALVNCENGCRRKVTRRDLESHMADSCPSRRCSCELCGVEGTHAFISSEEHTNVCGGVVVGCQNGCDSIVTRKDVEEHRRNCQLKIIECPYWDFGCEQEMAQREKQDHLDDKVSVHLDMIVERMVGIGRPMKLSEFTKRMTQGGKKWLSDGFYTGMGGYHMRLCVGPTIKRETNTQYLSVYINILPGVNDDNLDWPFKGRVTVMLLNQQENHNHKVHHLLFDDRISIEHTQRKLQNDEIFCGKKFFIEMAVLGHLDDEHHVQYLKNNALYFKVIAQIESETKPWLALQ